MIEIQYTKYIYNYESIRKAISDFKHLSRIRVLRENQDGWVLGFDKCKYGEERTAREFENYMIGLENQ